MEIRDRVVVGPFGASRGEPGAVRAHRQRGHLAGVAGEGGALAALDEVPQAHGSVGGGGGEPGTVRAHRHRDHLAPVAREDATKGGIG